MILAGTRSPRRLGMLRIRFTYCQKPYNLNSTLHLSIKVQKFMRSLERNKLVNFLRGYVCRKLMSFLRVFYFSAGFFSQIKLKLVYIQSALMAGRMWGLKTCPNYLFGSCRDYENDKAESWAYFFGVLTFYDNVFFKLFKISVVFRNLLTLTESYFVLCCPVKKYF